ncbi:MAG: serine/threonine-protein kinase, partial [Gemmatimonadaceae bacterium]
MAKICPVCGVSYADTDAFCPKDGTTLRGADASGDLIGSVIADRYLISKQLGEGGMGRVYLARHVRLPQQAAIKVMHPQMVKDQEAVARFNREAANAARIEHDRVARVFDFGETDEGLVYLAMEFVPGRTLRSLLEESARLSPIRAANVVYQVAEGLDAAHRIAIVHRDLKPDNIMVVTDEQGVDRCKVVDFGIAKAADEGAGGAQTRLTRTGVLVGTPEFMSPEQVVGEMLDARSDVYALALVAYQMFTGVLPFVAATVERSLTARLIDEPRPLSVAAPEVAWPAQLQAAFDRALDREPATRTASALEFADSVVAAVEAWMGVPVLRGRTPMSTASIAMTGATGSPPPASAAVTATVPPGGVLNSAVGVSTPTPVATTDSPRVAVDPRDGSRRKLVLGGIAALVLAAVAWGAFLRSDKSVAVPPPTSEPVAKDDSAAVQAAEEKGRVALGGTRGAPSPTTSGQRGEQNVQPPESLPAVGTSTVSAAVPNVVGSSANATDATGSTHRAKQQLDSLSAILTDESSDRADARTA